MPGCGKTTVGETLADLLGYSFIDMDLEIENQTGKSISDIFEEQGEKHFRFLEKQLLKMLVEQDSKVISTGGGVPVFDNNMELINSTGVSFYLKASVEKLHSNLEQEIDKRPLLNTDNLTKTFSDLLDHRKKFYEEANHIVEVSGTPDSTARQIAKILKS